EPVEAEHRSVAGQPVGAVSDQAGAKQWRGMKVIETVRDPEAEPGVGDTMRGKAAIASEAGEKRIIAEVFALGAAIGANSAGVAEPGHTHPLAEREAVDA